MRRLVRVTRPYLPRLCEAGGAVLVVAAAALVAPVWVPVLLAGVLLIGVGYGLEGGR